MPARLQHPHRPYRRRPNRVPAVLVHRSKRHRRRLGHDIAQFLVQQVRVLALAATTQQRVVLLLRVLIEESIRSDLPLAAHRRKLRARVLSVFLRVAAERSFSRARVTN